MIQLITTISDDISYYLTADITVKLNTLLFEIQKNNSLNFFNMINAKELEITKKAMINNEIVCLCLDYSVIDYAKTLAYTLNVPECFIYDIVYRRILYK